MAHPGRGRPPHRRGLGRLAARAHGRRRPPRAAPGRGRAARPRRARRRPWSSTRRSSWPRTYSTDESGALRQRHPLDHRGRRRATAERVRRPEPHSGALESSPDREVGPVRLTRQEEQWPNANAVIRDPSGACSWPTPRSSPPADVQRALTRMAHEVVERNGGRRRRRPGRPADRRGAPGHADGRDPAPDRGRSTPAGRQPRRGLLPRRHRPAPRPPRGGHRHPGRPGRQGRGAGRRRALHRAHHPGRPQRPQRLRPGPGRPAGRDGRPGPPRAAHPARLRGQEPARPGARRWSTSATTASGSARLEDR